MTFQANVDKKLKLREIERKKFAEALQRGDLKVPTAEAQEAIAFCGALEIVDKIKNGVYTAEEVMITMCLRAQGKFCVALNQYIPLTCRQRQRSCITATQKRCSLRQFKGQEMQIKNCRVVQENVAFFMVCL